MSNWKGYTPRGTRDILLQDCENKFQLENSFRKVFKSRGYLEVVTPTLDSMMYFMRRSPG